MLTTLLQIVRVFVCMFLMLVVLLQQGKGGGMGAALGGGATQVFGGRGAKVLQGYGLDKAFIHSTGHGLGLEIHEPPRLGKRDKGRLKAGMAITIEPGVYLEGFGGIRIEDTVLVTEKGCEILTPTNKELRVL